MLTLHAAHAWLLQLCLLPEGVISAHASALVDHRRQALLEATAAAAGGGGLCVQAEAGQCHPE